MPAEKKDDYYLQGIYQLGYGAVALHTTTVLINKTLLNLVNHSELIPILREEARQVLKDAGGEWTLESMSKLKKLDSVIKEAQRLGGPTISKWQRRYIVDVPVDMALISVCDSFLPKKICEADYALRWHILESKDQSPYVDCLL